MGLNRLLEIRNMSTERDRREQKNRLLNDLVNVCPEIEWSYIDLSAIVDNDLPDGFYYGWEPLQDMPVALIVDGGYRFYMAYDYRQNLCIYEPGTGLGGFGRYLSPGDEDASIDAMIETITSWHKKHS